MTKSLSAALIVSALTILTPLFSYATDHSNHSNHSNHGNSQGSYPVLPNPGQKIPLDGNGYFTYRFEKQPKVGTCILKVEIFNQDGKRDTSYSVKGDADMPSMRGAHGTGDRDFALSSKGVFLLPVQIAMPGDWEVKLTFLKNGKTVLRGSYLFDI